MLNTDIKQQNQYKVNDAWPADIPTSVDECLEKFARLSFSRRVFECHGAYYDWGCIRSSLDLRFESSKIPAEQRTRVESNLLESFAKNADSHFSTGACRHIDVARLKWKTFRNTGTVFVGRHYGLPTRCVDWTSEPLIALFFACRRDFENHGVVWWMDYKCFSAAIAKQWPKVYEKEEHIEDKFEDDFTHSREKEILIRLHYPAWMDRPRKQNAHIIMSGQYDVHHDKAIHRLGVQNCGRFIISSQMKPCLLDKLNRWGINGATLGIDDSCVETIAADVADKFLGQNRTNCCSL